MVAALNSTQFAGSAVCGECLKVKGELGEVVVRVVDQCPGCRPNGGIDLSPQAFEKIAPKVKGRVPVTLTLVSCNVTGNVSYRFKDGTSEYWTAIQVQGHKIPIAKLEYQGASGWVDMPRSSYNYFIAQKGVGKQPSGLKLRLMATDGQTLEDTVPPNFTSTTPVDGAGQFK
jgi:expansin (peptidoglycan-binding protein)